MRNTFTVLLLAAWSVTGIRASGEDPVSDQETIFYKALGRGDTETIYRQFHPALRSLVDKPVLEAWTSAARDTLGGYFSTTPLVSTRTQQLTCIESKREAEVHFESGSANTKLRFLDDQIVGFDVRSDKLEGWFQGPSRIDLYGAQSEEFIRCFLMQDAAGARSLMHDALKSVVSDGKLETMMQRVVEKGGELKTITLREHHMNLEPNRNVLLLEFDLVCKNANGRCQIEIQFIGLQGHLISFDFK